jgi:tetratricopeptide (TPR) repeat protein
MGYQEDKLPAMISAWETAVLALDKYILKYKEEEPLAALVFALQDARFGRCSFFSSDFLKALVINLEDSPRIFDHISKYIATTEFGLEERNSEMTKLVTAIFTGCAVKTLAASMALEYNGVSTISAASLIHNFVLLPNNDGTVTVIDFGLGNFFTIKIEDYYQQEGHTWVLKPEHRLSSSDLRKLKLAIRENPLSQTRLPLEQKLHINYFFIEPLRSVGNTTSLLTNIAVLYSCSQENELEEDYLVRAFLSAPLNSHALSELGISCSRDQKEDDAIAYYQKALAINPYQNMANIRLARIFSRRGDMDQARMHLQRVSLYEPLLADKILAEIED